MTTKVVLFLVMALVVCVSADDKPSELTKVVDDVKPKMEPAAVPNVQKSAPLLKDENDSEAKNEDDEKVLKAILKEEAAPKTDEKDTNTAQEETSGESDEDSSESDESTEDSSEEKTEEKDQGESEETVEESSEESESGSDSKSESEEDDENANKDDSSVSNHNAINAHNAQLDQLIASEEENIRTKLGKQEPKKFNQTILIAAIGVLTVVCVVLGVALVIKRRVSNARSKKPSPRNPIYTDPAYEAVTQAETA